MKDKNLFPFKTLLSLRPLIDFWNRTVTSTDASWGLSQEELTARLDDARELLEPITDFSALERHQGLIKTLMSAIFPRAFWEMELSGAFIPFQLRPFFASPLLKKRIVGSDGSFKGRPFPDLETHSGKLLLRAYLIILKKFYDIDSDYDSDLTIIIPDSDTGLDRYFRIVVQDKFVIPHSISQPPELTESERREIQQNLTNVGILSRIIPVDKFEFHGFSIIYAQDITSEAVKSGVEEDLVQNYSIRNETGFSHLEKRLRGLLGVPDLRAGIIAIEDDHCLFLRQPGLGEGEDIFLSSQGFSVSYLDGTVFETVLKGLRTEAFPSIPDFSSKSGSQINFLEDSAKSLIVAPLEYSKKTLGLIYMTSEHPMEFQIGHSRLVDTVLPIVSLVLKKELDERNTKLETAMLDHFSAVHRSIRWRFRQAASEILGKPGNGLSGDFGPITFENVHALYATANIRGASVARNLRIQADLEKQLNLALEIISAAVSKKSFPILDEASHQIRGRLRKISEGLTVADEQPIIDLVQTEIEPLFPFLRTLGPELAKAIDEYETSLDPKTRTVFHERGDLEESVSLLNMTLSNYLELEQAHAQSIFPHFFERRQTDGVNYVIYLGESMVEKIKFNEVYVKNLRLWQLIVCCGMAWHNAAVNRKTKAPLELSHVIFVSHTPVSIMFKDDKKQFDVDDSCDVGHRIIKSHVETATTKIDEDKLSQPDKIAIIYSRPEEAIEMKRHVAYLQDNSYLMDDLEYVELNEIDGIQGLRALRVSINVDSDELSQRISGLV